MRPLLTGISVSVLLLLNTLALIGPLLLCALGKLILPGRLLKGLCSARVMWVAECWAENCKRIFAALTATQWDIRGDAELRRDASYLIISNHQSWVDVPALIQTFNRKVPYFKFFLKQPLIWVPFLGLAFWALDYPFMKRYSKAKLEKFPHLKGQDLEITRRACEKFRALPVSVVNYLEGTRATEAKRLRQASPYRNLLKPKAGGVAFVLKVLGAQLDAVLDLTLVYPGDTLPGFWRLASGQVPRVIVDIQTRALRPELWQGDYQNDAEFRRYVQDWVSELWRQKDARIARLKREP
jgi:1-acyl-sn-glycerol-3-phosphate acyltransferase